MLLGALVVSSCGGVGQPATYDPTGIDGLVVPTPSPDPADFVDEVDSPWFPLQQRPVRRYVVEEDGRQVGTVTVEVAGRQQVAGLDATGLVTRTRGVEDGAGTVTRWYAQDEAGNVWLVGEDDVRGGWRAGEGGAEAGLAMPAEPRVGDAWVTAQVPGTEPRSVLVEEPVTAETGRDEAVRTTEVDRDGTRTDNVYAAGLGLVQSVAADGRTTRLVSPPAP